MKKSKILVVGLIGLLLAGGLFLVGCGDGDDSSGSNNNSGNPNDGGDPNNGGGSLSIRLVAGDDSTTEITTATVPVPPGTTAIYVKYQNSQGTWISTYGQGFSYQWSRNGSPINNPNGADCWYFGLRRTSSDMTYYYVEVNNGDTIAVTVTHSDGRTASKSVSVMYYP